MLIVVFRWLPVIISCFFVIFLHAATQIRRYADRCSRLLAIDACLFTKIGFLLSRMSTKINFCGITGHDRGGWSVAAAMETETISAKAVAIGWRKHQQWRRRKWDNNDGNDRQRRPRRGPGIAPLSMMAIGSTTTITTRTVTTDDDRRKGGGSGGSGNRVGGGSRGGSSGNCKGRQQSTKSSETAAAVIAVGKRHQARGEKLLFTYARYKLPRSL
jgi:hypothetical protein